VSKARLAKPRISPRLGLTVAIYYTDELDRAGAKECAYVSTMLGVVLSARGEINRHLAYACHVMRCYAMRLMGCESRALQVGRGTCWCEWLRCGSVRVVVVGSGG
jgi:hypothetical protein